MNLVLFDFDKTIINKDSGAAFMRFIIFRNPIRLMFCALAAPLAALFLVHEKTKRVGFSIWLWIATFAMHRKKVVHLRNAFIKAFSNDRTTRVLARAQLAHHFEQGDRIIIVSGASKWIVRKLIAQLALTHTELICSEEKRFAFGMVCTFHCISSNKVLRLTETVATANYNSITGYSDSASDIPMLNICSQRIVINPTKRCLKKFTHVFHNDMKIKKW